VVEQTEVLRKHVEELKTAAQEQNVEEEGVFETPSFDPEAHKQRVEQIKQQIAKQQQKVKQALADWERELDSAQKLTEDLPEDQVSRSLLTESLQRSKRGIKEVEKQIEKLKQDIAKLGSEFGSIAESLGILGVYALGVAKLVGKAFTYYGAHTQAMQSFKETRGDPYFAYLLTFAVCSAAGAMDDLLVASEVAAPVVMDSWDTEDAGPTQVLVGNTLRVANAWYEKQVGLR
jgi:hypothetical protein